MEEAGARRLSAFVVGGAATSSDSDYADRPVFGKESGRISEDQLINSTWTPSFYGYDGHGSTRPDAFTDTGRSALSESDRFLTNMAGGVTDTYQYDAFGNLIESTGTTPNNDLFAGEQFDPALGFYYMRARYYRPATGRFWTTDPIEGKLCCGLSQNPYIYALDNPANSIDPTGRGVLLQRVLLEATFVGYAAANAAYAAAYYAATTPPEVLATEAGLSVCPLAVIAWEAYGLVYGPLSLFDREVGNDWAQELLTQAKEWCEATGFGESW